MRSGRNGKQETLRLLLPVYLVSARPCQRRTTAMDTSSELSSSFPRLLRVCDFTSPIPSAYHVTDWVVVPIPMGVFITSVSFTVQQSKVPAGTVTVSRPVMLRSLMVILMISNCRSFDFNDMEMWTVSSCWPTCG